MSIVASPPVPVLVEYRTDVQRLMVLRMLRYCLRIWEREAANRQPEGNLTPIVPVVFHQGRRRWGAETSFEALFPEEVRRWATTPGFTHVLMDQVGISPAEVRGGYRAGSWSCPWPWPSAGTCGKPPCRCCGSSWNRCPRRSYRQLSRVCWQLSPLDGYGGYVGRIQTSGWGH